MADEGFKRKLAAILSADVEGYSRLMDDDEEATVRTLTSYRNVITDLTQQFRGRIIDTPGDNILADFISVVDAVNCAVEIQRDLAERNAELPDTRKMQFRIGVNLGDVIDEDGRIYGDGVNIAARVESLAEAGGICISGRAHDQVENKLGLEYEDLGKHEVKNISRPIQVYRVLSYPGAAAHRVVQAKETLGRKWRKISISAAVIVVIVGALGVWQFYTRRPTVEPASVEKMAYPLPEKPSIAVLPFDNMSGDPKQEYFSDGISEEIISALSKTDKLFVIARNSTFTYKGKPVKVKQVAQELGVRYVLEGSVRIFEERVRITAQLIDATKGHHLWAERYDRELKDIFALQDEITMKIVNALQINLTEGDQARLWVKQTENLDVYLKTMEATSHFRKGTKENIIRMGQIGQEIVDMAPESPLGYKTLAWYNWYLAHAGISPKESITKAFKLVQKTLSLDESDALAYSLLGAIYTVMRHFEKAIAAGEKSVELDPNGALAHVNLGGTLCYAGRIDEGIDRFKQAIRLNPYPEYLYLVNFGRCYRQKGEYEKALEEYEKAYQLSPDNIFCNLSLAAIYALLDRQEEAEAAAKKVLEIYPKFSIERASKSWPYKNQADLKLLADALRKAGLPYKPPLPLPDKSSIAVLAFDNLSGDPEQEYFSDGIAENIITALSKVGELFVIARNSSFTYKGKPVKVQQVGRELGVRYVLEGSVQKSGDRVRITAQLIDAKNGHHCRPI
jgi:TolB-like protein/class 3 adenylate cyclase